MKKEKVYSFWKGLLKTLVRIVIIAGPIVIDALPSDVANLSVSAVLMMLLNWAKQKYPSVASVV